MVETIESILENPEAVLLVGGGASEGPVWHPEGFLTFVRFELNQLVRWHPDEGASILRDDTEEGNGCALDRQGRLVMCEGLGRRVTRTEQDGTFTVLADRFQGARLNKPNDVVCRRDGTIYFTDPAARVPHEDRELGFSGVFLIRNDSEIVLGTDECEYPNGLAFSPDESILYVAITRRDERCFAEVAGGGFCPHQRIRAFDVLADGTLTNNRIFADLSGRGPGHPDGIKVDTDGRVYCTAGDGIWVFDRQGVRIGVIPIPEQARNFTFGGPESTELFVAAGDSIYRLPTTVRGAVA